MSLLRFPKSHIALVGLAITALTACQGDKKTVAVNGVDYTQLKVAPQTEQPLSLVSGDALAVHIKNGLRLQVRGQAIRATSGTGGILVSAQPAAPNAAPPASNAAPEAAKDTASTDAGFSETNVHVAGVDEADVAKYDGHHWFVATYPTYEPYNIDTSPRINIVATDPVTPSAKVVSQIALESRWGGVGEMYLVAGDDGASGVAALQNQWGNVYPMMPGIGFPMMAVAMPEPAMTKPAIVSDALAYPYPVNSQVKIDVFDVKNPAEPAKAWSINIDGSLVDSRKVDNVLYLVTRFDPWVKALRPEVYSGDANRTTNEATLADVALTSLLPRYKIDDVDAGLLSSGCYLQASTEKNTGYASLINITAIDLAAHKMVSSRCIDGAIEGLSMTRGALYLTGTLFDTNWQRAKTVIHKFTLGADGANYKATGSVEGYIGQNADPAFKLNEYKGDLRVVTTSGESWNGGISHHLWVLEDTGTTLKTIAQLPNKTRPAAIGKPGEDIYSVRFEGDKGYIVTFRRTDPLYKLDLSNRIDPKITGELSVPGFATYMHPVGENYLFAIGQNADENGRVLGLKVALMDVSGDNPKEIETILLGSSGSSSEALRNLKALSFLQINDDELRVTMPVNVYQNTAINPWGSWQYTGLELFEINGITTAMASLAHQGTLIAEQATSAKSYPSGNNNDRGILHDDAVFFAHANGVWAANWAAPKEAVGPVIAPPINCTANVVSAFALTVKSAGGNACDAKVSAVSDLDIFELKGVGSGETCVFAGPNERVGSYYLQASLEGFSPAKSDITVYKDNCHVVPVNAELTLKPITGHCAAFNDSVVVNVASYGRDINACNAKVTVVQGDKRIPLTVSKTQVSTGGTQVGVAVSGGASATSPIAPPIQLGGCEFSGAIGVKGEVSLEVELAGYETVIRRGLFVAAKDACFQETIRQTIYF